MALDSQDVVTDESISQLVQAQTEQSMGYREAFRDYELPAATGPSIDIPTMPEDNEFFDDKDVVKVPEGTEYPRADPEEMGTKTVATTKRGFESAITDEALARGQLQRQLDITEGMARSEAEQMDSIAGSVLLANVAATKGDADGTLSWSDLLAGRSELVGSDYAPDLLLLDPLASEDLLGDERVTNRSTAMSDEAIQSGQLPPLLGMDRVEVSSGGLGEHNAVMVDTSMYGYELTEPIGASVKSYREENKDQTVYKVCSFKGWAAMDTGAAVKLDG